jgi:ATP-dependent RNA helicase A
LKALLRSAGIPEACLVPKNFDFFGHDEKLDLLAAFLGVGLYPKVSVHREEKIVLTTDMTRAVICTKSVNLPRYLKKNADGQVFPYPFFVCGEKLRVGQFYVSCKNLTLVTPLHVLLFGCKKVGEQCIDYRCTDGRF